MNILDLAPISQANISVIAGLGHKPFADDMMRAMDSAFGTGDDAIENQADPARIRHFFAETLDFLPAHFHGALVWDTLQFLSPQLLQLTIERLRYVLRGSAHMLALFHAETKGDQVPFYSYKIVDAQTLSLTQRGHRRAAQQFNNRGLEKVFHEFSAVKFFLTRDNLREIIVRR